MTPTFDGWAEDPKDTHDRWQRNCKAADLWTATHCRICKSPLTLETTVGISGDDYVENSICINSRCEMVGKPQ